MELMKSKEEKRTQIGDGWRKRSWWLGHGIRGENRVDDSAEAGESGQNDRKTKLPNSRLKKPSGPF